ncbi:hypothetical protein UNDYM_3962 [Undibacterium sp. YM2]|uniref:hypothetical protein n=1 Tax=Undibacterium sp. YM2 TaxID=2058625 RepID=UPI001331E725|nr:hypothetical protein [Undibacterium sp. YM2]BBB68215.1 hypothetical protein UNDYM_3962 [Undibacterium sp. YM2]
MSSPQELILHIAADVEISDIEDILHIKFEPVDNYYDFIATVVIGQMMVNLREPFWKSYKTSCGVPFKFRIEFECENSLVRSREILMMQLCKELHAKFGGHYVASRDDAPIEFWTDDKGFIINEAERAYYDMFPHHFTSSNFINALTCVGKND